MFEDDCDIDFGADFTVNFEKEENHKRPADVEPQVVTKKIKIATPIVKRFVERKFPGPAGILPDSSDCSFDWTNLENPNTSISNKNEEIPCSQMSMSVFQTSPWIDMCQDFQHFVDKYDIRWVKRSADLNKLRNQKAPFLAGIIKSIECFEKKNSIVRVTLKDQTSEIYGTIIYNLYKEHAKSLVVGSVIVVRECGVLTTSYSSNHYVIISPDNLVAIYANINDELQVIKVRELDTKTPDSQISVRTSHEEEEIWQNALDGVDMDSLFGEEF